MDSIRVRSEKRIARAEAKEKALKVLSLLSDGATAIEFGNVALVHDGTFQHLIKIEGEEEIKFDYSVDGVLEALGWKN